MATPCIYKNNAKAIQQRPRVSMLAPACLSTSRRNILCTSRCASTTWPCWLLPQGLWISRALQWHILAHTCARPILPHHCDLNTTSPFQKTSATTYLQQCVFHAHSLSILLACVFSTATTTWSHPTWLFHRAGASHLLSTAVSPVHDSTRDTCTNLVDGMWSGLWALVAFCDPRTIANRVLCDLGLSRPIEESTTKGNAHHKRCIVTYMCRGNSKALGKWMERQLLYFLKFI